MDQRLEPGNGQRNSVDELTPLKGMSPEDELYFRQEARRSRARTSKPSDDEEIRARGNHPKGYTNGIGDIPENILSPKTYLPEAKQTESDQAATEYFQKKRRRIGRWTILVAVIALGFCVVALIGNPLKSKQKSRLEVAKKSIPREFDEEGRTVLEDYDTRVAFSNFLPGLAGIYGKPLYAFFVNRGQAIAAFGTESKEYPILEFNSANKAYQSTSLLGFRTFLQCSRRSTGKFLIEPFSPLRSDYPGAAASSNGATVPLGISPPRLPKRIMYHGNNELQIQELDFEHEIETNVTYFILPEEDFGAFVRRTTITNLNGKENLKLSALDGLARMEPAGGKLEMYLKNMGETLQSFMGVYFPYDDSITMPFYRLTTQPADVAKVQIQDRGHYCLSVLENEPGNTGGARLLPIVYDTSKVFGEDTSLLRPVELFLKSISHIVKSPQYGKAKTSSCFGAAESLTLHPGQSVTISTFYGAADHILQLPVITRRILQEGFVLYKLMRTREVIKQISDQIITRTNHRAWDSHVRQMFLDNALRGGIPLMLGDDDDGMYNADEDPNLKVFHVFSRIHGDLERDYNEFVLSPTFFSQGPVNFRDVIQNRRDDVVFNPRIGSFNVKMFLSFIQADAYQPLSVEAVAFSIRDIEVCKRIAESAVGRADGHRAQREALIGILNSGSFRPGQLFGLMEQQNIELVISRQEFIDMVVSAADSWPMAVYKNGFWADHWTYYMDLITSYLAIYPDGEFKLMYETDLPYFYSPAFVQPRSKKYVLNLAMHGYGHHVQQLDSTVEDAQKLDHMSSFRSKMTGWYDNNAGWQHQKGGGHFKSTVVEKLLLLGALKFSTRDVYGMGIEYESGKPGWDDANNGLPGMIGSGMPETYELKVLLRYLLELTLRYNHSVSIPIELSELMRSIDGSMTSLEKYFESELLDESFPDDSVPAHFFRYWDEVSRAREDYRERTKLIFSGNVTLILAAELAPILNRWLSHIDKGIERATKIGTVGKFSLVQNSTIPTYFAFEVMKYKRTGEVNRNGHPLVLPKAMKIVRLPVYLEGPTRMMKTLVDRGEATTAYWNVRKHSGLHDTKLSMYTMSADLMGQSIDIGRTMAFPSGWGENQGVSMHMSYKFYLELLRHGLHDEFFSEATAGGLLPFMDSNIYGRSLTECSSFIVSSAFEDPSLHGRGFLARLSGATAEFLSIWILMFVGPNPFFTDIGDHQLRMQLVPTLPLWMFETRGAEDLNDDQEMKRNPLLRQALREHPNVPTVRFKLFSSIQVYYYNERRENLFGIPPSRYRIGLRDGSIFEVHGPSIGVDLADKIRRVVFVEFIEAYF